MSEGIGFCNICSNELSKCKCTEEDQFRNYHKVYLKTFGIETVLVNTMTYLSILAKRIEKLENNDRIIKTNKED